MDFSIQHSVGNLRPCAKRGLDLKHACTMPYITQERLER